MAEITIRLPAATPHAYLAWVTWWKDVEELLGSDLGKEASLGASIKAPAQPSGQSVVVEHVHSLEAQARQAISEGRDQISPELRAEARSWGQWLRYGERRRDWLEALSLRGHSVPRVPEDLVTLWEESLKTIQATVSDQRALRNVAMIQEGREGDFQLIGELEVTNFEAVAQRLESALLHGDRLQLDLSEVTFIDSRGLQLLIRLGALAEELDLTPVVINSPSLEVRKVLGIAAPDGLPGVEVR
jgi:anti-anti-sigma regulatory factor